MSNPSLVEKTDRLYLNIKDWVTIDELGIEVHFVKENVVLSEDSRSSEEFMHGIKVLMAKNYIDKLGEEVRKGMIEKARQGHWPTVAPVGYRNNLATHRIQPDPERAPIIVKLFEWYASGQYSLKALTKKAASVGLTNRTGGSPLVKPRSISCFRIRSTTASSTARQLLDSAQPARHPPSGIGLRRFGRRQAHSAWCEECADCPATDPTAVERFAMQFRALRYSRSSAVGESAWKPKSRSSPSSSA